MSNNILTEQELKFKLTPEELAERDLWRDDEGYTMFEYGRVKRLELEMNNTCFLYCGGCGRTYNPVFEAAGKHIISLEDIKKFFPPQFCKQLHYFLSCGNYGDPTAHPETLEILKWFRDNGTKNISFSTNGASRSPDWWAEVAQVINGAGGSKDNIQNYWGGRVTWSIDGLGDTNHLYKVGAKWERVMENAKAFIDAGGRARWQWIIMNHNEHQKEEAKALAKEMGFSEFIEKVSFRYNPIRISRREAEKFAEQAEWEMLKDREVERRQILNKTVGIEFSKETIETASSKAAKHKGVELSPIMVSESPENRHPYREKIKKLWDNQEEFFGEKKRIICQNIGDARIYVDATGKVWPCNWLGGIEFYEDKENHWPMPQHKVHMFPEDFNSLYRYKDCADPVKEILEHPFYTHVLEEDWKHGNGELQPRKCKHMCHTELGEGIFEAMRRNEQNLKTGEYRDISEVHDTGVTVNGVLQKADPNAKHRWKHQGGTGIGPGSVKPVEGLDASVLDIKDKDD